LNQSSFEEISQHTQEASPEFMRGALLTLGVGLLVFLAVLRWAVPEQSWRLLPPGVGLLLVLVAWRLLGTRGVWAAKQLLALGGWALVLVACFFMGGVLTPGVMALPVLLVMMGWLFSIRAAIGAGVVTTLALWAMVAGDALGWLPDQPHTTPLMYGVMQSVMVALTVFMTVFMVNSYQARARQIGRIADQLTQRGRQLEASQQRLQTAIEVSGTVFWEYDLATQALSYDTAQMGVLGLDASRPPRTVHDFLVLMHPEDRPGFVARFGGLGRECVPELDHDCRVMGEHNGWIWVHTKGAVIRRHADGSPSALGGGVTNIQARKLTEEALRASEQTSAHLAQMLRSLCDNAPDMIWAKDLDKRYIFANQAVCDQLLNAQSTDEPLGKDDLFFAQRERTRFPDHPHWHTFGELCQDSDALTLQRGAPGQFEESGHIRGVFQVLDVHKAPFVDHQGQVVGVVGTARNITSQKMEQDRLQLAALVLEHSSEALMITDAANAIVEVNPAFTHLTGYSRDDILGQTPAVLRSGRQTPDFYRRMWQALTAEGQWQGEICNRRKSGEVFVEWLTINTLYDADGQPHRRVALFSDMTEKKKEVELLWQQANFDTLTMLPNRRMFQDRLEVELKKRRRTGGKLAVFFMDLDHFKEVNDTLGHDCGDQLLVQAAQRILACVRESDTVARLGGDEFTVILTDIESAASVARVAQAIVDALSQPFDLGGTLVPVSVSLGIAVSPDQSGESGPLVLQADQAMYAAKRAGRNAFRFSDAACPVAEPAG
jgi:diguanylate cyclase (GGDEF)-like protein/PAS domain S-box-containing protein